MQLTCSQAKQGPGRSLAWLQLVILVNNTSSQLSKAEMAPW